MAINETPGAQTRPNLVKTGFDSMPEAYSEPIVVASHEKSTYEGSKNQGTVVEIPSSNGSPYIPREVKPVISAPAEVSDADLIELSEALEKIANRRSLGDVFAWNVAVGAMIIMKEVHFPFIRATRAKVLALPKGKMRYDYVKEFNSAIFKMQMSYFDTDDPFDSYRNVQDIDSVSRALAAHRIP